MTVPFVLVDWRDAWADAGGSVDARDADVLHKPTVMRTAGWLVRDTEAGVSLFNERCLDAGEEHTYRGRTFIPREMIQQITPVLLAKQRKPRAVKAAPIVVEENCERPLQPK